jgi:ATP-dependent Lhr-like helicase
VEEIDAVRRLVFCKKVDGKMKVSWPGEGGIIHTRILQKMKEVLCSCEDYPYLLPNAKKRLAEARRLAKNTGLDQKNILPLGGKSYAYFPWLGTRGFQALKRLIKYSQTPSKLYDIQSGGCYFITFKSDEASVSRISKSLTEIGRSLPERPYLVPETEYPAFDKYDSCLPREKLVFAYMENRLDLKEAKEALSSL